MAKANLKYCNTFHVSGLTLPQSSSKAGGEHIYNNDCFTLMIAVHRKLRQSPPLNTHQQLCSVVLYFPQAAVYKQNGPLFSSFVEWMRETRASSLLTANKAINNKKKILYKWIDKEQQLSPINYAYAQ